MSRYIDADNLHNAKFQDVSGYGENVAYRVGWNDAIDAICENEPSIDIEPKRGEWKIEETESVWGKGYMLTCSECGDTFRVTENALSHEHFCRNCGAMMKGADDEASD